MSYAGGGGESALSFKSTRNFLMARDRRMAQSAVVHKRYSQASLVVLLMRLAHIAALEGGREQVAADARDDVQRKYAEPAVPGRAAGTAGSGKVIFRTAGGGSAPPAWQSSEGRLPRRGRHLARDAHRVAPATDGDGAEGPPHRRSRLHVLQRNMNMFDTKWATATIMTAARVARRRHQG